MTAEQLVQQALTARDRAHAPYSGFRVGAALLDTDGTVWTGCNIENASYGLTLCAERVAIFKAISEGARSFTAIAVASEGAVTPCGACRQILAEFAPEAFVHMAGTDGAFRTMTVPMLLPHAFGGKDLT